MKYRIREHPRGVYQVERREGLWPFRCWKRVCYAGGSLWIKETDLLMAKAELDRARKYAEYWAVNRIAHEE